MIILFVLYIYVLYRSIIVVIITVKNGTTYYATITKLALFENTYSMILKIIIIYLNKN